MNTFSDRLREARVLRGYTQQALARVAGLSQSAIASYECGRRHSSRATRRLARALHVHLDWLETGAGPRDLRGVVELQEPAPQAPALHPRDQFILNRLIHTYIRACLEWPPEEAAMKKPAGKGGP
ncbi:helix-turn-helix domain-containing protein [Bordetella hinzii]|uniref:helix-turn-helix domain-containing protein n=1 Tax=Bordetella hinzii TaxID=103855 RepID=UPI00115236DF|nr:helix-turn-helix transcriptional regulator [Bordetella hinzii]